MVVLTENQVVIHQWPEPSLRSPLLVVDSVVARAVQRDIRAVLVVPVVAHSGRRDLRPMAEQVLQDHHARATTAEQTTTTVETGDLAAVAAEPPQQVVRQHV